MPTPDPLASVVRMLESGEPARARAALSRLRINEPRAHLLMARAWALDGDITRALHFARQAASAAPTNPAVQLTLARYLASADRTDECLSICDACIAHPAAASQAHEIAAAALVRAGRFAQCARRAREGLALDPASIPLRTTLANACLDSGQPSEAASILHALSIESPDDPAICDLLCNVLNYVPDADPRRVFLVHQNYGRILRRHRPDVSPPPPPRITKPLRVGLLSPDFKSHSVAFFIEPFLRHHDRSILSLYAYHTNARVDDVTARLRPLVRSFVHLPVASDDDIARRVRSDSIDILIDLSGHTRGESLLALYQRPAPIQVTYLGYPNTTGVPGIDYRIVDSITDPPTASPPPDDLNTERLVRLDRCFLCYQPPDAPPVAPAPCIANGFITFGSFNALQKINPGVLSLWSRILAALPSSRLYLKATNLTEPQLRESVLDRCRDAGIDPARVTVEGPLKDHAAHLSAYAQVDIALDPFPYNGTTTTCDSLWMGVPVLTLAGRAHAGRVGASLLSAIGHPNWIAQDPDSFVSLAAQLAHDIPSLQSIRTSLRAQVASSPLCDAPAFSRRFESCLLSLWHAATTPFRP